MYRHVKGGALLWVALCAALAGAPSVHAAEIRIAFIDTDRIFADYPKTKEIQVSFNREVEELSRTAREKKTEIDQLQRKLDEQLPMLSDAKKDEENKQLLKKIGEYESFVQAHWGPNGKISQLNEQYLKPIIDRVHNIVASIGTDEGYSLILDAADGNVVYGDKSLDLTDRVLSMLKAEDDTGIPYRGKGPSAGSN
jgi:outer membrane protein